MRHEEIIHRLDQMAAQLAALAAVPSADRRGSVEYKQEMAHVLTARALHTAIQRAGGRS